MSEDRLKQQSLERVMERLSAIEGQIAAMQKRDASELSLGDAVVYATGIAGLISFVMFILYVLLHVIQDGGNFWDFLHP